MIRRPPLTERLAGGRGPVGAVRKEARNVTPRVLVAVLHPRDSFGACRAAASIRGIHPGTLGASYGRLLHGFSRCGFDLPRNG